MSQLDPEIYTVAWIAPLEIEARAALYMLDKRHQGRFPLRRGDDYIFYAGSMCGHNIIIATLPAGQEYGTGSAAALASQLKKTFRNLWFGLLVGVAAGLPDLSRSPPRDIRLGDVLVGLAEGESAGLIAYDLGKESGDGFQPLRFGHLLAATETIVRSAIGSIKIHAPNDADLFLPYYEAIRNKEHATGTFVDPGQDQDRLYNATEEELEILVDRERRPHSRRTRVWYGPIGSGEKLINDTRKRNELRDKYGLIGLEMEAAGTMNRIPVGVIRGVCSYGDQYEIKEWQPYAAAMAAAFAKAVLHEITPATMKDRSTHSEQSVSRDSSHDLVMPETRRHCYIPLRRNRKFTGRSAILEALQDRLFFQQDCQRLALLGLGGVGKTQVALELAYWAKENQPEYSILWVPALSNGSFEQAYTEVARRLDIRSRNKDDDLKELVRQHLESEGTGKWFIIIDNADELEVLYGSSDSTVNTMQYLPESENCVILFTTRAPDVAISVAGSDVLDLEEMDVEEAISLMEKSLSRQQLQEKQITIELVNELTSLPLAVAQAAAYLNRNRQVSARKYLELMRATEDNMTKLLSREFHDGTLFQRSQRAVATTWIVSFDQIRMYEKGAADLLLFVSCIEPKAIPRSILPHMQTDEQMEHALGTLCGYAFLVSREDGQIFDMHRLVHMATRIWTEKRGLVEQTVSDTICHLARIFPSNNSANRDLWREYLPHTLRILGGGDMCRVNDWYPLCMRVGQCLRSDRRFKEAVRCFEEACRWTKERFTEEDNSRLKSEHELANAYLDNRQPQKAISIFEHVAAVWKKTLLEEDPFRLASQHNLAVAYLEGGRVKESISIFEQVAAVHKKSLSEENPFRWSSQHELARAYLDDGRVKKSISIFEHVVAVCEKTLSEDDHSRLSSQHNLARAYLGGGRIKESISILEHVVAVRKKTLSEEDHSRLLSEHNLARAYLGVGRIKEAISVLEHVVSVRKKILSEEDRSHLHSQYILGRAYLDDGRIKESVSIFEHVVAVYKKTLPEEDYFRLSSQHNLARAYLDDERIKESISIFEHVAAVHKKVLSEENHSRLFTQHELARAYLKNCQTEKAIQLLEHVVEVEKRILAEDNPKRLMSVELLRTALESIVLSGGNKNTPVLSTITIHE